MKKTSILLALAVAGLGFTSCEDDKEPVYTAPTEFVLNTPPMSQSLYILSAGDIVDLTCSQPDYGFSAVTNYVVDLTIDNEFREAGEGVEANYVTLKPVNQTSAQIQLKADDIASAICQFHGITGFAEYPEDGLAPEAVLLRARASLSGVASSAITSNTVKLNEVQIYNPFPALPGQIYLVGAPSGWVEPAAGNADSYVDWQLVETGVGTKVYVGSFEIPAGEQYFRFYESLSGWGSDGALPSIGPNATDGDNSLLNITDKPLTVPAVPGKGSWYTSSDWAGGAVTFTVDLSDSNNFKLTVVSGAIVKEDYVYMVGSQAGWQEPSEGNASTYENWRLVDRGETGIYTATFTIPAGELYFRIYPGLTGWGPTPYAADAGGANIDIKLDQALKYVQGEGCWLYNQAEEGELTFTLDTHEGTMTITNPSAE